MPGPLDAALGFAALILACWVLLLFLGFPLRWTISGRRPDFLALEATFVGAALFSVFAWHWSHFGSGGLRRGMPWLLLAVTLWWGVLGSRDAKFRASARSIGLRGALVAVRLPVALLVATLALFALHFPGLFDHGVVAPVSAGNNDLPFYALNAGHLERGGFEDPSEIATHDLGREGEVDVAGAFLFLAGFGAVTGRALWELTMPMLGLGVLLVLAALARLARCWGMKGRAIPAAAAVLALSSGTFFYSLIHGYLAYALTLGAMIVVLALVNEVLDATGPLERRQLTLVGALLVTWLYVVYPHVAFFLVPLLAATAVLRSAGHGASLRTALRSTGTGAASLAGMFLLPCVLVPDRVVIAVQRTFNLEGTTAGWSVGRVRIAQWLGLAHFPDEPTGADVSILGGGWQSVVALSVVFLLVAAFGLVVALLLGGLRPGRRRAHWLTLLAAIAVPIALYEVLHVRYGELYQAWKAMTYLQPVVAAAAVVVAWHLLCSAVGDRPGLRCALGATLGTLVLVAALGAARPRQNLLPLVFTDDHLELETVADRFELDALNIALDGPAAVWDSLWAMHLVQGVHLYPVTVTTYVKTSPPRADWTLRRPQSALPLAATRHPVNERFVVDFEPVPSSP